MLTLPRQGGQRKHSQFIISQIFTLIKPSLNLAPGPKAGLISASILRACQGKRDRMEVKGSRSRSRRSWIWNQFFVIEEYAGPEPVLIGRLHTDMDRNDGRTKYVLRGEGAGSVFVIDEKTGNIHVTKPLDREEKDEYRLIATATDRQTDRALEPSSQFIIRVQDINDNPPVFDEGPYSATVPEMANIGTSIIQVTATDADDPTYGNSAKLVYTLVQGQQYFSVDPQTGILRTAVPDMDRETQDQYLVVLQAKDMGGHLGGLSGTTTVTVRLTDVNDNPPRFTQSMWSFSVSELAIPGAEIGRISATDADLGENAKLEYTILEGESGDTFNITGRDQKGRRGRISIFPLPSRSSYSFSVEVLNPIVDPRFLRRGPFKDRASIRVAVLDADEPPRFSRARYHMDVSENCPPACTVGRVSAVDPDTGLTNNIRFSIDPQSDPEALFRITPETGLITTAMELDREREHWHNITVIATQRGYVLICFSLALSDNPSQVSRVLVAIETLDLNDNAPELDRQYNTAMCDSSSIGQVVQVLRAIDRDEGGNDSTVYFSIPPESSAALNFSVRDSASLVLLSQIQPLSRSPSSTLTLYVPLVLRDGTSGLTSTGTVTVSVCPCLKGGREAVCLPQQSTLPSPGLSTAALLAILACVATLLAVSALSLSLRRQKRDSLSPLEEDDVRENIITYDDEGGGEADTAAFDIAALQSAPVMGFGANWVPGMEAARGGPGHGGPSLALRVGEFLRLRLAQVTFDPSQPPYDSVQVYGLEGTGSRAGSLSSLESEGEKDSEKEDWGAGLEEWGPQFQKLAQDMIPPPPPQTLSVLRPPSHPHPPQLFCS
uniref:Cadherin domain-containing protein n=1 Tax=Oreochromis aureus TaxID=47969 RepID=A0AAZ1X8M7_OREAU